MYNFNCKHCGLTSTSKRSDTRFCSAICRVNSHQEKYKKEYSLYKAKYYKHNKSAIDKANNDRYYNNKQKIESRLCEYCRAKYEPTRIDRKFCSNKCGIAHWNINNKEYIKLDHRNRYHSDLNRRLSVGLRSRLNKALKGNIKSQSTMKLLGCSIKEFKNHLESQFEPWMNWNNHGNYDPSRLTWHMDHVIPMHSFNLSDPIQQKLACNYTNIRPLLAKDNLIKGAKRE